MIKNKCYALFVGLEIITVMMYMLQLTRIMMAEAFYYPPSHSKPTLTCIYIKLTYLLTRCICHHQDVNELVKTLPAG